MVKEYHDKYGVNILWNFDDTLDFKTGLFDKTDVELWGRVKIEHLPDSLVKYALNCLDEFVLQYFNDEVTFNGEQLQVTFVRDYFPRKIFVAKKLSGNYNSLKQYLSELDVSETSSYYSVLWNGYEQLFAFDSLTLETGNMAATNKNKAKISSFYCFLSNVLSANNLYAAFPDEFYAPVEDLYSTNIRTAAELDEASRGEGRDSVYYKANWYIGKGFALTRRSPYMSGNSKNYDRRVQYEQAFPDYERDIRNFLHVMLCESEDNLNTYYLQSPVFVERMRIFIRQLYEWGIDVYALNPLMKKFYEN